jgi:DNA polymerase-3 subunit epsilon
MVATAPRFDELAPQLFELLAGRLFVAHNARFDYGFIKQAFKRLGQDFRATTLCTVKLSRKLYPLHRRHNLDALIERHGLQADGRHRALADARLIHQFWQQAQRERANAFDAAMKLLAARPTLPAQLGEALIEQLPEKPGVYVFRGAERAPLYVGKSRNIRQRVLAHFAADVSSNKEMRLAQQVCDVEWHETGGEIGALLKEAMLIKSMQPTHNRRLRHAAQLYTIALIDSTTGARADIREIDARALQRDTLLHGLFSSARQAENALRGLMTEHGLCAVLLGLEKTNSDRGCFGRQLGRCRGACVGAESELQHAVRLTESLATLRLRAWPFAGPAVLREADEMHVVDRWAWLGTARSEAELHELLDQRTGRFDRDTYRILVKHRHKLTAVRAPIEQAAWAAAASSDRPPQYCPADPDSTVPVQSDCY